MALRTLALALAICLLVAGAHAQIPQPSTGLQNSLKGFIRTSGLNFVDDNCNDFVFSGYNTWEPIEAAAELCCGGRAGLDEQLALAVANNLTVIRMFAFPVLEGINLELEPGVWNETLFQAFDYVVAKAGQLGLKLLPALANNWDYNNNMTQTKCWYANNVVDTTEGCDQFWTDAEIIQLYKNTARAILTRVNSITGVAYGNDPTFFAWNLINEGRCETANCTAADIQSWIQEVAPYVKTLTKSLVTVGQEGFYQASNCHADNVNPAPNTDKWALAVGQDFIPNHVADGVDFASFHMWSDNWGRTDVPFAFGWLYAHMEDAATIGKPLVLEEFGKASAPFSTNNQIYGEGETEESQMQYYKLVYAIAESSIAAGQALKGIAFWRWDAVAVGAVLSPLDSALTLNSSSDAFSEVVLPFSQRVKERSLTKASIAGCTPVSSAPAPVTATPAVTQAGRRLQQVAAAATAPVTAVAPAAALTPETANAAVTNCSAYFAYSIAGSQGQ